MINNVIKRIRNIMRQDAGINGDAQRIEQMVWMFFLKVYDAQEEVWECTKDKGYSSIIPEELRWRNWAIDKSDGKALTGDELLQFVNNELFPKLKALQINQSTPIGQAVVQEVFSDLNQYMKNGTCLRQIINIINEVDFSDAEDRHTFGDIYEGILKELQSAGSAGEFYTPRALTDFMVKMLNPKLGEKFGDFTSGTGGFLVSGLNHLKNQVKNTDDEKQLQNSVLGQEWKPLPYLLCITNLLLHGIEAPNVTLCDSLGKNVRDYKDIDKVDVIAMNPPYGGSTEASVKGNFPSDMRSSETADLFMVLIMYRLKVGGRAAVIVPDGFLFGTDGAKLAIKTELLKKFNLHTIIRLPGSIFSPYTSISTNILFFNNEKADGSDDRYNTKDTWFYRLDMPAGYKHFSKTNPMKLEHCQPIIDWWNNRYEIVNSEKDVKSKKFSADYLISLNCNFDQCKFPKEDDEILPPAELIADYLKKRAVLDREIDETLNKIKKELGIKS
jgi:type I restriction enzyme M protein